MKDQLEQRFTTWNDLILQAFLRLESLRLTMATNPPAPVLPILANLFARLTSSAPSSLPWHFSVFTKFSKLFLLRPGNTF